MVSPPHAAQPRRNLLPFAGIVMILLALFNGWDAMAALIDSPVVTGTDRYVFGDLHGLGWALLVLAIAQGLAGITLLTGDLPSRWFPAVVLCANAFTQFVFLPSFPAWSLTIIAIDLAALYVVLSAPEERNRE
ncbi:hypothetical protein F7Q99_01830 [Streptomyces kaniharaensis]|uniref:DUF7144 domain-containing protein n=1 Tax=Streptomyces kaniharaensis TaxID=212423 RepID=A0A6N7KN45_9ACTN|nr:hypothetical protein [Streptomyces kaniharaensis]MQS11053.1 hypothetical protein [Streptomyces kaniharaensis]